MLLTGYSGNTLMVFQKIQNWWITRLFCTQIHSPARAHRTLCFMSTSLRTPWLRWRCVACKKSAHSHCHPSGLAMSMPQHPFVLFPALHSSSSASLSKFTTTVPSYTRSRCTTTQGAPATREEPGWFANSFPRAYSVHLSQRTSWNFQSPLWVE